MILQLIQLEDLGCLLRRKYIDVMLCSMPVHHIDVEVKEGISDVDGV